MTCYPCLQIYGLAQAIIKYMHAKSKAEDVFVSLRIVSVGFLFRAGPLCAWQLVLRLSEFEKSLTGTYTQGVLH